VIEREGLFDVGAAAVLEKSLRLAVKHATGHEHEALGEAWKMGAYVLEEVRACFLWHREVAQHCVELPAGFQERTRVARRARRLHVQVIVQRVPQRLCHCALVVDQEHSAARSCSLGRGHRSAARQPHPHRRTALRRALDLDAASEVVHDALADRQAESRADTERLGREKRLERAGEHLLAHAAAVVRELCEHGAVGCAQRDFDPALGAFDLAQRVRRVAEQVGKQLLQARRVAEDARWRLRELGVDMDVRRQLAAHQMQRVLQQLVELDLTADDLVFARERL